MNDRSRMTGATGSDLVAAWGLPQARVDTATFHGEPGEAAAGRGDTEADTPSECARTVVADKLARLIHIGLLRAGDELPSERDLCEVLGVGRQTVRAALGILEGRLMVAVSHGRRSRVRGTGSLDAVDGAGALKRLQDRRASDVFQALQVFEAEIASLAVTHVGQETLAQLDALVSLLPRASRNALCYQILEYELRALVYGSCGNKLLADMAMDFYGYASGQRRRLLSDEAALRRSAELQAELVDALHARDAVRLTAILREQAQALAALPSEEPPMIRPRTEPAKPRPAGPFGLLTPSHTVLWPTF